MKKSLNPCSKDSHRLFYYRGSPCVTTEIITFLVVVVIAEGQQSFRL